MKTPTEGSKEFQVRALRLARSADRHDVAIAKKRLAEIKAHPDRLISGSALRSSLSNMTEAPASKPINAPVQASAPIKEKTMKKKAKKTTTKKRSVSEAAANLRDAKTSARKASPSKTKPSAKTSATDNARTKVGVRPGSKLEIVANLLKSAEGTTTTEILSSTGWPAVSVPQMAKAAGLELRKEKTGKVTRYWGTPAEA